MNASDDVLKQLAFRARLGDAAAAAELRQQLGGGLVWIVRRALRGASTGNPTLDRAVRAEADRVAARDEVDPVAERARFVGSVTRGLTQSIVDQLQSRPTGLAEDETVCGP